jgi:recombination protein RecA
MAKSFKQTDQTSSLQNKKLEAVRLAMEQITKAYGEGSIMKWEKRPMIEDRCYPHRLFTLDLALGVGVCLVAVSQKFLDQKPPARTTICLHLIKEAQKWVVLVPLSC